MVRSRLAPSYTVPPTPVLAPLGAAVEANRRKERQLEAHIDSLSSSIEHIEDALVRTEAKAKRFAEVGSAAGGGGLCGRRSWGVADRVREGEDVVGRGVCWAGGRVEDAVQGRASSAPGDGGGERGAEEG